MMNPAKIVEIKNAVTPEKTRQAIFEELRDDLGEWMTADVDSVWRPPLELTKEGHTFAVRALLPAVDASDVEVMVAPDILLIKGQAYSSESGRRKFLRSINFPEAVNPDKVRAVMKDGMLFVKADIAESSEGNVFVLQAA
jgi:HSP20 family molecular chaperone IbpA